ncbi:mRNA cleavage and polyadenylation specificity factor complex endoribonuclease subunit Ysh1 [Myxozyma melibiosi]|uniref:Endoribonuclease YSH1 n=1 Tax=Myxozyma melibiosi TaxID=54550 RepID=A0ABR1F9E0_9ASCO
MSVKKIAVDSESFDESDYLEFIALGGGSEVGRSCHVISYKGKTVMLDAGVHPAMNGMAALPFYDDYDLSSIDILLISHFHLDHAASLPYVMTRTDFKGRVFMTHPTKAIYRWLLSDYVRVSAISANDASSLYTDADLSSSFERIEAIDYHSTTEVDGIKFTAYHAGHVLGAAMYFVEIGGIKVLFTGDYSREEDRHLNVAEVPPQRPDILITESTYGTSTHQPRQEKEARLLNLITKTILNGGRCLLPVFSLGNAQELLLVLDEYWQNNSNLDGIPVFYASSLARKCLAVYQTYINMMNDSIRKKFRDDRSNPFQFKHIRSLKNLERFDDLGPCVMVASPGMLQNGVSRELLERWAPDAKNTLIITGYSVEGTLAKQILNEPSEFPSITGGGIKVPRRIYVEEISFAAHVDFKQNSEFIDLVNASNIILVHGEQKNMGRLKAALLGKYKDLRDTADEIKIFDPRNSEEVRLPFRGVKVAKVMGSLASKPPMDGQILSGILVQKNFEMSILALEDLQEFSGLSTTAVVQRQTVTVDATSELVKFHLQQMFGAVKDVSTEEITGFMVMDSVTVWCNKGSLTIEWEGNMINDAISDTVLAILLSVDSSPVSVKISSKPSHCAGHFNRPEKIERLLVFLDSQFGSAVEPMENPDDGVYIKIDQNVGTVNFRNMEVVCSYEPLRSRIRHVVDHAVGTILPLTDSGASEDSESGESDGGEVKMEVD